MLQHLRRIISLISALALMLTASDAMALIPTVGSITYGPLSPIPTLSGYMLAVLTLLFAVLAFRVLRTYSAGKPLASLVAMGILALGAAAENRLFQNAQAAIVSTPVPLNNSGGGSVSLVGGINQVTNNTGQPQQIHRIDLNSPYTSTPTSSPYIPECSVGMTLQSSASCYLDVPLT